MAPAVTAAYAALCALLFLRLALRLIRIGRDDTDPRLPGTRLALEDFTRFVPFALVLLMLLELLGTSAGLLHALGAALIVGRLAHATAFLLEDPIGWLRMLGTGLTLTAILASAIVLFGLALL